MAFRRRSRRGTFRKFGRRIIGRVRRSFGSLRRRVRRVRHGTSFRHRGGILR